MSERREPPGSETGPEPESEEVEHELRALYRSVQPPPLADDATEADSTTARVVQWMQASWRTLEVPPATLPVARELRPVARARRTRTWLVAAAALVLLAGSAYWLALRPDRAPAPPPRVAQVPAAPPADIEILDVSSERVELRSGPVRLVLLEPAPADSPPGM